MTYEQLSALKEKISTPAYVFDKSGFTERAIDTRKQLGDRIGMCFSIKANPFLIDSCFQPSLLFDKFEVCSIGELHVCMKCNISPEKILFSGVNKSIKDIVEAFEYGVRLFTVESHNHLRDINCVGTKNDTVIPVLVRISADSQFGMDESDVLKIIKRRCDYSNIDIVGVHYFTGTQKKGCSIIQKELEYITAFCNRVKNTYNFMIQNVEYGTGLDVNYFMDQKNGANCIDDILPSLQTLAENTNLTIEMGRYFAATCGYYFTKVVDCKTNNGTNYAIVDGGMNQLHYDGQIKSMKIPLHTLLKNGSNINKDSRKWSICGSICSTEDVICRDVEYEGLEEGDTFVFKNCGAYSFMEAMSTFLSREMPQIWACLENENLVLLRDFVYTEEFNYRNL